MNNLTEHIGKSSRWIFTTFKGDGCPHGRHDIPGQIAKWLFRVGTIWAVLLIPVTLIFCAIIPFALLACLTGHHSFGKPEQWLLCPYLISGYAIWIGWGWRSRQPRNIVMCILFWLLSAGFNVMQPLHFWMDSHDVWVLLYPPPLWGIVATTGALAGILFEFSTSRYANRAA